MKKKIAYSNTKNRENYNKNIKTLNLVSQDNIENLDIVFKHKTKKRSIKNDKNSLIKLLLPIIIFSILFIIGIIMLILFLVRKKKSASKIEISISDLSYEEAEKIMNLQIIGINHNLLNMSLSRINDSLEICENINFSIINSTLNHIIPQFLNNTTKTSLKVIKADLKFYKQKYEELKESIKDFTIQVSNSVKNSYSPLNKMKKEISNLLIDFENIIKNLCLPLLIKKRIFGIMDLRKLNEYEFYNEDIDKLSLIKKIELFRNDSEKLNILYNQLFKYINGTIQIISDEFYEIPELIEELQKRMELGMINFEERIESFTEDKDIKYFHENLIEIKKDFISLKNEAKIRQSNLENRLRELENEYYNNEYTFINEQVNDEVNNTTEKLNSDIYTIEEEYIEYSDKYSLTPIKFDKLYASNIIVNSILVSLNNSTTKIKREQKIISNEIDSIGKIINVEGKTSLDLLFIIDATESMGPYIDQVKQNIINIMNRIPMECPGININLGFIAYRDEYEIIRNDIVNIEFTQNFQELENKIKTVFPRGGADYPEEVAWGIEKALEKNWNSDARYSILIADSPCHGTQYHNGGDAYPDGVPGRKNIEILIKELAEKNVSLYCVEITEFTDIMFKIFGNIYSNYPSCQFQIVTMASEEKLPDIVVDSAVDVYIKQRKVQINRK